MTKTHPKPPKTLTRDGAALWRKLVSEYIFTTSQLRLLEQGILALDQAEACRARISNDGLVMADRFGQLQRHPLLAVQRDQQALFVNIFRKLDLDLPDAVR
jgi:phage terminase small subunit